MATATETKNIIKITDAGPSKKKISIEIPAASVDEKIGESMAALATEAELPGFRKGKAPKALIEKRFGKSVRNEAKNQLVAAAYTEVLEQHKLKVVGEPTSESLPKIELVSGKSLTVELEVEVMPEFDMPKLDGIEIVKPVLEVSEENVEKEITNLKVNEGDLETRETLEAGDYATGHAVMKDDKGTEFYNINGAVVQAPTADKNGRGMILGIWVDDFSKQLGKPKVGDTVTIKAKGPDGHEVEGIRNADLTVTFKIDRMDRIIPASLDKVLESLGMQFEDQLKEAIRTKLRQNVLVQQQTAMRQQLAKYLLEGTKMDLPERLTTQQAARNFERRRMELMYRGVKPAEIEEHIAELRNASASVAVRDLKLMFVMSRVAEDLNVRVEEAEVNNRIVQMAYERGARPDKLRQELIQSNQVGVVFQQVRDHKAMDMLIAKAKVSEMSAEEFNKKFSELEKAEKASKKK